MIPTEPGYYWRHGPNHDGEVVDQIVEVKPIVSTAPNELFYWECGDLGAIYIQEEEGVEWSGPVLTMADQVFVYDSLIRMNTAMEQAGLIKPSGSMVEALNELIVSFVDNERTIARLNNQPPVQ